MRRMISLIRPTSKSCALHALGVRRAGETPKKFFSQSFCANNAKRHSNFNFLIASQQGGNLKKKMFEYNFYAFLI